MSITEIPVYRKVNLTEAKEISANNPNASIIWRPDESLPEDQQYALVYHE
jgi:hypothetical protein